MRYYCERIQNGDKNSVLKKYQTNLRKIKKWYQQQYDQYQLILQSEMFRNMSVDILERDDSEVLSIDDYSENFGAKLSLYCMADFLCKHMLSCYSYGPERSMGLNFNEQEYSKSWFDLHRDAVEICEILQFVLQDSNEGERINLGVLLEDRNVRSGLTHSGDIAVCMSAIRCYNILRDMLIFIDSDFTSELPRFEYPNAFQCDIPAIFEHTNNLDFKNGTTILISGPLHDIQEDQKVLLANMPWDIVIDFDGVSQFGGLRSAVSHERIRSQLLTPEVASNLILTKGVTAWLTCGEFVSPTHSENSKSLSLIPHKRAFHGQNHRRYSSYITGLIKSILDKVADILNPVTILYLYSDDLVALDLVKICEEQLDSTSYSFTGIYYLPDERIKSIELTAYRTYQCDGEDYSSRFKFFSCNLESFFSGLMSYKEQFSYRDKEKVQTSLPSSDGLKMISVNDASNLNDFFEVLYSDCGNDTPELAQEQSEQFFRGGSAPWCAFRSNEVAELIRPADFDIYINRIRTQLGRIPDANKDKIFYIEHTPGIGGSTLMRHIGWSLHEEYPVILIKRYEKTTVSKLITRLYDQLHKGVVILADETFEYIEELEQDIKSIPRACVLIASVRQRMSPHLPAQKIPITRITDKSEEQLRKLFKKHSPLTKEELIKKDLEFSAFIKQDQTSMRCPFMIGLYYMEQDFKGVSDYVEQIIRQVSNVKELKAMAFICLVDLFGQSTLPATLINNFLGISSRSNYIDTHPYVKGAFIKTIQKDTIVYISKHYLISQYLLDKCSIKIYGDSYQNHLSKIALDFIEFIMMACHDKFSDTYQLILERVFITSRIEDVLNGQSDFARIIEEIQVPEARKQILLKLAESSASLADRFKPLEIPSIYMMTAHFFGHLSRLCSKRGAGIENNNDAVKFSEKAIVYMEQCGKHDPLVYHMHGDARLNALKRKWEEYRYQTDTLPTTADYSNFEDEIELINSAFDKAAEWGSPDYALTSQMDMLISYLRFVFKVKKICKTSDLNKLSDKQEAYRLNVEELLSQLDGITLQETTHSIYVRLENEYRSDIMMNDYGKAIEYYQNKLNELQRKPELVTEIIIARHGLINARLGKYRSLSNNGDSYYSEISEKDVEEILRLLEATMEQSFDANRYQERQRRISVFSRWFQLSKFSRRTVEQGIQVALRWEELAKLDHRNDLRPYYYLYILYYLSVLDGSNVDRVKANNYQLLSYQKAQAAGYKMDSIRDLLIEGNGMGRLYDIRHIPNIAEELAKGKLTPMVLRGYFEKIETKKGLVQIRQPISWINNKAKFKIGENNTLGEAQVTHKIEFFGGFGYEQIIAIDSSVKDIDSGENTTSILSLSVSPQLEKKQINNREIKKQHAKIDDKKTLENLIPDTMFFIPKDIYINNQGIPKYLNGTIGDFRGGLSDRDLQQFDALELEKFGGVRAIMELLLRRNKAFPVVITGQNAKKLLSVSLFLTGKKIKEIIMGDIPEYDLSDTETSAAALAAAASEPIYNNIGYKGKSEERYSRGSNLDKNMRTDNEDKTLLLSIKGKTVQFTTEKETANGLSGSFTVNGRTLNGLILRLTQKERKRLINQTFSVKVISSKSEDAIIVSPLVRI